MADFNQAVGRSSRKNRTASPPHQQSMRSVLGEIIGARLDLDRLVLAADSACGKIQIGLFLLQQALA